MLFLMRLVILYRPNSEHARKIETFLHDFRRQYSPDYKIEVLDLNTRDGAAMASIYDIVRYPGMVVAAEDGSVVHSWQGPEVPLMSEVASYLAA